ncbi:MAG: glutamate synthase subunit alpha, partial [Halanaerobacter sp.]
FGGKLIVQQPAESDLPAYESVIAGNTILYGATEGELYMNGIAGERFGVRNSGVQAVVEGIGDHGCEYMTGGRVVVLGQTGRNFGAGMSGGIAYVYDIDGDFKPKVNDLMVNMEELTPQDLDLVKELVTNHVEYTDSERGKEVLENWDEVKDKFVKVIPPKYKKIIAERREEKSNG